MKKALLFSVLMGIQSVVEATPHTVKHNVNAEDTNMAIDSKGAAASINNPPMYIGIGEDYQINEGVGCGCEALSGDLDHPEILPLCEPGDDKGTSCH